VLNFALTIDKSLANKPPQLQSLVKGISIKFDQIETPHSAQQTGDNSSASVVEESGQVPEPLSLLVWSALAGTGLSRTTRARRRA
jgi:hypothetical protein